MHRMFDARGMVVILMTVPMSWTVGARHAAQATASPQTQHASDVRCAATPLQGAPFHRPDLRAVPWIAAVPASAGISGHLFYAGGQGTRFVRVGPHSMAAALHTHGATAGKYAVAMKILWVLEDPHGGAVPGPLTITGRDLAGRGRTHQIFSRTGSADYPSIIDIPTQGCWQLQLSIRNLAADTMLATGVATMIVVR